MMNCKYDDLQVLDASLLVYQLGQLYLACHALSLFLLSLHMHAFVLILIPIPKLPYANAWGQQPSLFISSSSYCT